MIRQHEQEDTPQCDFDCPLNLNYEDGGCAKCQSSGALACGEEGCGDEICDGALNGDGSLDDEALDDGSLDSDGAMDGDASVDGEALGDDVLGDGVLGDVTVVAKSRRAVVGRSVENEDRGLGDSRLDFIPERMAGLSGAL